MRAVLKQQFLLVILVCIAVGSVAFGIVTVTSAQKSSLITSYSACVEAGYPMVVAEPPVCRASNHNFTGTPYPSLTPVVAAVSTAYETLVNADTHSSVGAHHQEFINTQAQWESYWFTVHSGLPSVPPLIPVDFTRFSVVAVSLGPQPMDGYGIKITNLTMATSGSIVSVTESSPTITCQVAQVTTNRYLIVRTKKLIEPVSFRITAEKRHCP